MKVLIIGGSGYLGAELVRQSKTAGHTTAATYLTRPEAVPQVDWCPLDLRRIGDVATLVGAVKPSVVVNAAFRRSDWTTTADGAVHVAMAAADAGARLVHLSSDAVFSGTAVDYDETCVPDPTTPYGAAKAAAETAIRVLTPGAIIARTSLIIGDGDSIHETRVHDLVTGRRKGVLFTDDVRCPVHVTDLAAALLELAESEYSGVRHVAGADALSRHEIGLLIARRDGLDASALATGLRAETVLPGPIDVRLDSTATQRLLDTELRGARAFLRA